MVSHSRPIKDEINRAGLADLKGMAYRVSKSLVANVRLALAARVTAAESPRALNEPVGLRPSYLRNSSRTPTQPASRGA